MKKEKHDIIDAYLSGTLKKEELKQFKKMIEQDAEMKKELKFQQEVMESLRDDKKLALRTTLNEIMHGPSRRFIIPKYSRSLQMVAAVLLLAVIVGGSFIYKAVFDSPTGSQQLFEEYFAPEYDLMTVRSITSSNTTLYQGMNHFANQDYANAIGSFNEIPDNMLGKLYTGFSYMHLENYEQAEQMFQQIIDDDNSMFLDQAAWHLGLCYLASEKEEQAISILKKIANGNTFYKTKALELLTRMGYE